jgi:putative NADH-flavin reductase
VRIAIIGATGHVGTSIVAEALRRKHTVTAIARDVGALRDAAGLRGVAGDIEQTEALAATLRDHDAIVSAMRFSATDPAKLLAAVRLSGVQRYLVVGGAGSLLTASGETLLASGGVPEIARTESEAGQVFLDLLRDVQDLDWTMLCPAALFWPGDRTGAFRLGGDELLIAYDGKSRISYDDYAIALLDEIEQPEHHRRRFSVGY